MRKPKYTTVSLRGGLELEKTPLEINPGQAILMTNFGVKSGGGYYYMKGYERFDGQTAPSDGGTRSDIEAVPGEGDILGVWMFQGVVYAFRNATGGATAVMYKSSASGWTSVKTGLNPDGRYEFVNYNFYGSSPDVLMLGCDGQNPPFKFDGTTYTAITVPTVSGEAQHIAAHKNHLFLSYPDGQIVHSVVGDPTDFTVASGAGALGVGDDIVALRPLVGGALGIFMRNRINVLYGDDEADWDNNDIRTQSEQAGAIEWSMQPLGDDMIYMDDRGLTSLKQTETYGNFAAATFDDSVKKYLQNNKANIIDSCISRDNDEYRLFFSGSSNSTVCLTATFGNGFEGFGRFIYPFNLTCICSLEDTTGAERIFAGADNGYVYELEKGTSHDGAEISASLKTAFHFYGSSQHRKRFRAARFNLDSTETITLEVKPDFDFGNPDEISHVVQNASSTGGGGFWGEAVWSEFTWGGAVYPESQIDIFHSARNMSFTIHVSSDSLASFTIYNYTVTYSMRALER